MSFDDWTAGHHIITYLVDNNISKSKRLFSHRRVKAHGKRINQIIISCCKGIPVRISLVMRLLFLFWGPPNQKSSHETRINENDLLVRAARKLTPLYTFSTLVSGENSELPNRGIGRSEGSVLSFTSGPLPSIPYPHTYTSPLS